MEYKILRLNDDNTAHTELNIGGRLLNQDIDLGLSDADFKANLKTAFGVFKDELKKPLQDKTTVDYGSIFGKEQEFKL